MMSSMHAVRVVVYKPSQSSWMLMASKIIYGTAWKQERTTQLVVTAVLAGFRAIDTAGQPKHYREELVGEALQILHDKHGIKREDLFLQTKFSPPGSHDSNKTMPYNPSDPIATQIETSFNNSLKNLRTTYVDSYLLHSPLQTIASTLEAWRALVSLQDAGKVRQIGVSNAYDVGILVALSQERKVQVVQNRWYEGNGWDNDVQRHCMENGIQYQSFWSLTGSPSLLAHPDLLAIAKSKGATPEQIVFRMAQAHGITPLTGTTNETHMRQDLAVQDIELGDDVAKPVQSLRRFIWKHL